jgi:SAM-dependent methyltransferase
VAHDGGAGEAERVDEGFEKDAWERHWKEALRGPGTDEPNPYLLPEVGDLVPGTALDAGCGTGADAVLLAERGWRVTGVDVAPSALAAARERAVRTAASVSWLQADLTTWAPEDPFDLVLTAYAHASIPQLELYRRLTGWVAPGGTLLIVAHAEHRGSGEDGHEPPPGSTVALEGVTAPLEAAGWRIRTAREGRAQVPGHPVRHHDVIVRAERPAI